MRLKRVKIYGFKTFAERTELDLDGGVIAVVGPNGCGKSNIVDSILWGLGETSAKHIRAQTGQEVIFSGSQKRKPVGYAEVSLLFDNEDGVLPIDSPEVSISRKLTRAGDSQYQINRRTCRLKDIADLLADSGLGRAGYAIVGQSEIDQALAASAHQRRAWIDEAAGVQRYRIRRQESLRRLESAEVHLQRIRDLMAEIEAQRAPLEEEAETARRCKSLQASLREIEVGLLVHELHAALKDLADHTAAGEAAQAEARRLAEDADAASREAKTAHEQAEKLEVRLEELRELRSRAQSQLDQAIAQQQIAASRIEGLDALESRMSEEQDDFEARIAQAILDLESAAAEFEKERGDRQSVRAKLGESDAAAKKLARELEQIEVQQRKGREILNLRQKAELEAAHRADRRASVVVELDGIRRSLPDLEAGVAEAKSTTEAAESARAELRSQIEAIQAELQQWHKTGESAAAKLRSLLAEIAALEGRRRGMEATFAANEGLAQGARAVMKAVEESMLEGDYTPVGQAVSTDAEYALAIDTALGGSANDLIVPHDSHAKRAIELLKRNRLGRATFQPINLMRPVHVTDELRQVLNSKGVVGLASQLCDCDPEHRPVIDSLLGRVVIADDIDAALKLANTRGWSRIVTLEGEVVHGSGAVSGGAAKHQGLGMVQRQSELEAVKDQIDALQKEIEKSTRAEQSRQGERGDRQKALEELQSKTAEARAEVDEAKTWLLSLQHEHQSTLRSQQKLELELAALDQAGKELPDAPDLDALSRQRDEILTQLASHSADSQQAESRLKEADERHAAAEARHAEAKRRHASLIEADHQRKRRAEHLVPDRKKWQAEIIEASELQAKKRTEIEDQAAQIQLASDARRLLQLESQQCAEKAAEITRKADGLALAAHQGEIAKAKADSRRASASQRLLEEYGLPPEEALQLKDLPELPPDAAQTVPRLRREIKSLGDVNLGAIEAYERLTERSQELHDQSQDIESGRNEVLAGIKELDRLTRTKFVATFTQLQEAFSGMFTRIFEGGEGSLELTDNENILDSGVDISVTIPGKRRQRLELLSGGERALSALAFLFALLKVKPSPLVILDEVDAPLDGRNVERFLAMMREFRGITQFICITHNPVTIEAADVWFGVTMQEPGVSTVVPFRVPVDGPSGLETSGVSLKG